MNGRQEHRRRDRDFREEGWDLQSRTEHRGRPPRREPPPPPAPPVRPPPYPRRHPGKRVVGGILIMLVMVTVSILPVNAVLGRIAHARGAAPGLPWQVLAYGIWFYALFWIIRLVMILRHRRHGSYMRDNSLMDSALEALDRIASGDFDIVLKPDRYNHYYQLIDKINEMARGLSSMEHMRQDFVSNVSHEIGSPLTSIQGFARLLRRQDLAEADRLHYLEVIEAECGRLSKLSENLLKLSLLDSESAPVLREPLALDKQLSHVVLLLEPHWLEKGLEVQAQLEPVRIRGDEALLEQLWINLIQNAVKFTPAGGSLWVTLSVEGDEVVCTVRDSGIGIAPEDLPHIFERFYKADRARTRGAGGSGLGLSLAKKITSLHGGCIEVESALGEGTVFRVRFPKDCLVIG